MNVKFSAQAQRDLRAIADWLLEQGAMQAARSVPRRLRQATKTLRRWPERFPVVAMHRDEPVRARPLERWVVLYQVYRGSVLIARIADSSQDYLRWFSPN